MPRTVLDKGKRTELRDRQRPADGPRRLGLLESINEAPAAWNPYDWSGAMQFWGIGGGPIAFDYGSRTFRFGASVDEAEARDIVNQLRAQHSFHGPT